MTGFMSLEDMIARPSVEMSLADEYIFPPLVIISTRIFDISMPEYSRTSVAQTDVPVSVLDASMNNANLIRWCGVVCTAQVEWLDHAIVHNIREVLPRDVLQSICK